MRYSLALAFKGNRNYLQGGDIYNAINASLKKESDMEGFYIGSLCFKGFATNQCELMFVKPMQQERIIAYGYCYSPDLKEEVKFYVVETNLEICGRVEYDEDSVLKEALICETGLEISSKKSSVYTPIEEIIALTKKLNYINDPVTDGQWVFGKLNVCQSLTTYKSVSIKLLSSLKGKFSQNEILLDGASAGKIQFIVGRP